MPSSLDAKPFVSLRTHIPLWHASPKHALAEIEKTGIFLMREYVWCGFYSRLPIQYGKRWIGDYVLSLIALPRDEKGGFLWGRTRGEPGGDSFERTFDHGGGGGNEVKVWTAIPRQHIVEIIDAHEVERRLQIDVEGDYPPGSVDESSNSYGNVSCYERWLPDAPSFQAECASLVEDSHASSEVRIHAALYSQKILADKDWNDVKWRRALIEILAKDHSLVGDAIAVCSHLLSIENRPWLLNVLPFTDDAPLPDSYLAKIIAFASATHDENQIRHFLSRCEYGEATASIADSLPRLIASNGKDKDAIVRLTASNKGCADALAAVSLGCVKSGAIAVSIIQGLAQMPPEIGTPALISLLRRRRDLKGRARKTLELVLAKRTTNARDSLSWIAQYGLYHPRLVARRLLLRNTEFQISGDSTKVKISH